MRTSAVATLLALAVASPAFAAPVKYARDAETSGAFSVSEVRKGLGRDCQQRRRRRQQHCFVCHVMCVSGGEL